jgi:hypothetical protein
VISKQVKKASVIAKSVVNLIEKISKASPAANFFHLEKA